MVLQLQKHKLIDPDLSFETRTIDDTQGKDRMCGLLSSKADLGKIRTKAEESMALMKPKCSLRILWLLRIRSF